ncbi:hypothetical protein [Spirosoma sp. KNUC1025]|uniref:hypothetical protein n=1 Tax=Spirosoma sp. KNUC1025 TaxID=2894082 RepID=UPI0038632AA6|nr:hypothetical protein LN737_05165 [Spirosoma sp. KNUC1025]
MPFKPGQPKIAGRKRGSKNRVPLDLRSRLAVLLENQFENIQDKLEQLDPKEYVTAYVKMLEFVVAKKREEKIDLSNLTDEQVDDLLNKIIRKTDA